MPCDHDDVDYSVVQPSSGITTVITSEEEAGTCTESRTPRLIFR